MSSITEQDIEQAITDGNGNRILRLAMANPIFTLRYIDARMRELSNEHLGMAKLKWLMEIETFVRSWFWHDNTKTSKMERDIDLGIMQQAYRYGSLFLIVGAGLSMGEAGLVRWKDLVIEVLKYAIELGSEEERLKVANGIRETLYFAAETAEEEVRKALADHVPIAPECRLKIEGLLKNLIAQTTYDSDELRLITEVVKQCLGDRYFNHLQSILYFAHHLNITNAHQAIAAMARSEKPRLSAILTYNFDDLLEKAVTNAGKGYKAHCSQKGDWIFQNGYKEGQPVAIDIFHVHGYVPSQMQFPTNIDLVFSANEYEHAYGTSNTITQSVNQAYLSDNALGLVLGSSLTDNYAVDQMKTLHAQSPGWYHYVLMDQSDKHTREYYREMGLRVHWISDYDEIPQLLHEIAEL